MRKFPLFILLAVSGALTAMILIQRQSVDQFRRKEARIETLRERQGAIQEMNLGLERYRRLSANFRKMTAGDMDAAQEQLKHTMRDGLDRLEQMGPNSDETESLGQIARELDEMLGFAEKFQRVAYNKDAYQKPEMVGYHQSIERSLSRIEQSTDDRVSALEADTSSSSGHATSLLIALAALVLLLYAANMGSTYWTLDRPLRKLYRFSSDLRAGKVDPVRFRALKGMYGDIQSSVTDLFQMVQGHARERHKFILDVVSDLRSPLTMVAAGKHLLARGGESVDPADELRAVDSVKRGLAMLAGSLEDFDDIVEYSRLDARLDENLVDLSEVVCEVARTLNAGPGLEKQISTSVPPMPVWMRLDARRLERVLIQVITKVAGTLQRGTGISVSVEQPTQGSFRGVEILVQDSERARDPLAKTASGPSVDVLKHWIAESGLGMTLAHRVIKAQGGTLSAAGVTGTSVQVSIRLPQERLAQVGLISAPRGLELKLDRLAAEAGEDGLASSGSES